MVLKVEWLEFLQCSGQEIEIFGGTKGLGTRVLVMTLLPVFLRGSESFWPISCEISNVFRVHRDLWSLNYILAHSVIWGLYESNPFQSGWGVASTGALPFLSLLHGHYLTSEQRPWGGTGCVQSLKFLLYRARTPPFETFPKSYLRILLFSLSKFKIFWSHLTSGAELIGFARPFH